MNSSFCKLPWLWCLSQQKKSNQNTGVCACKHTHTHSLHWQHRHSMVWLRGRFSHHSTVQYKTKPGRWVPKDKTQTAVWHHMYSHANVYLHPRKAIEQTVVNHSRYHHISNLTILNYISQNSLHPNGVLSLDPPSAFPVLECNLCTWPSDCSSKTLTLFVCCIGC